MIPVTKSFDPPITEYIALVEDIWARAQFTNNGPLCRRLSSDIESFLGVDNLELVSNGTLALQLSLKALNLKGEIITTPYSYVATLNSILWEGCKPIFVDIERETFCIDATLIENAITENTQAILATHVYGYPCNVHLIQQLADKHGLKIVYDAAHAFGVRLHGKSILKYGDCSTLSFHATKLFHSGEGGAIVSKTKETSERISLIKKFGHIGEDDYIDVGINAKMSELHAALGLCVLPHIHEIIARRKECSEIYDTELQDSGLQRPAPADGLEYNYAYYPVIFPSNEIMMAVRRTLLSNNIGPRRYFFPSLNTLPFIQTKQHCPNSEDISSRVLCLPLYVGLTAEEIKRICELIKTCLVPKNHKNS